MEGFKEKKGKGEIIIAKIKSKQEKRTNLIQIRR